MIATHATTETCETCGIPVLAAGCPAHPEAGILVETTPIPVEERLTIVRKAIANIKTILHKPTPRYDARTRQARWDRYCALRAEERTLLDERDKENAS